MVKKNFLIKYTNTTFIKNNTIINDTQEYINNLIRLKKNSVSFTPVNKMYDPLIDDYYEINLRRRNDLFIDRSKFYENSQVTSEIPETNS